MPVRQKQFKISLHKVLCARFSPEMRTQLVYTYCDAPDKKAIAAVDVLDQLGVGICSQLACCMRGKAVQKFTQINKQVLIDVGKSVQHLFPSLPVGQLQLLAVLDQSTEANAKNKGEAIMAGAGLAKLANRMHFNTLNTHLVAVLKEVLNVFGPRQADVADCLPKALDHAKQALFMMDRETATLVLNQVKQNFKFYLTRKLRFDRVVQSNPRWVRN